PIEVPRARAKIPRMTPAPNPAPVSLGRLATAASACCEVRTTTALQGSPEVAGSRRMPRHPNARSGPPGSARRRLLGRVLALTLLVVPGALSLPLAAPLQAQATVEPDARYATVARALEPPIDTRRRTSGNPATSIARVDDPRSVSPRGLGRVRDAHLVAATDDSM